MATSRINYQRMTGNQAQDRTCMYEPNSSERQLRKREREIMIWTSSALSDRNRWQNAAVEAFAL